jgi:hypothetical protein
MFLVCVRMVFSDTMSSRAIPGPSRSGAEQPEHVQLTCAQWLDQPLTGGVRYRAAQCGQRSGDVVSRLAGRCARGGARSGPTHMSAVPRRAGPPCIRHTPNARPRGLRWPRLRAPGVPPPQHGRGVLRSVPQVQRRAWWPSRRAFRSRTSPSTPQWLFRRSSLAGPDRGPARDAARGPAREGSAQPPC